MKKILMIFVLSILLFSCNQTPVIRDYYPDYVMEKNSNDSLKMIIQNKKIKIDSLNKFVVYLQRNPVHDTILIKDTISIRIPGDTIAVHDTTRIHFVIHDTIRIPPDTIAIHDTIPGKPVTIYNQNIDESSIDSLLSWGVVDTTNLIWNVINYHHGKIIGESNPGFQFDTSKIGFSILWYYSTLKYKIDSAFYMDGYNKKNRSIYPGSILDGNESIPDTFETGKYFLIYFEKPFFIKSVTFITSDSFPVGLWLNGFQGQINTGEKKVLPVNAKTNYLNLSLTNYNAATETKKIIIKSIIINQ